MFLLDVTLPGVSPPPSKSPGQVLQSSIPTIAIGALMTVLGGGALWKGVGSTGRILPYLRWVLAIGGPLVAASGFMPASSSGPGLPPLPATPAVTTHPTEPLNLDDDEIEHSPRPRPGIIERVKNFFCGTGTNELLDNLLAGDVKGGKLIKDLSVFLNSPDFATRKRAASAMVQNAYGEDGSSSLANIANSYLGIALVKDSDNAIVEGILEGLTGLEVCREAAPALKELQSILGETGEAIDFQRDLGTTVAKRNKRPKDEPSTKEDRAKDFGISLSPPIIEEIDDEEPVTGRKSTGLDLEIDGDGELTVQGSKKGSKKGSSPDVDLDDSGVKLVGLEEDDVDSDSDIDLSGSSSGSSSKSKPKPGDGSDVFELDFEEVPSLNDSSPSIGGVVDDDEDDSDFDRLVGFAEEDAEEAKDASKRGSSSTPIRKEEKEKEKDIFDEDDFEPRASLDSDSSSEIDLSSDPDLKTPESIANDLNKDFKKWGYSAKVVNGEIIIEKGKDKYTFSRIDSDGDLMVVDNDNDNDTYFILKESGKVIPGL